MNYDQITGQVRTMVPAIIAWVCSRGVTDNIWLDVGITVGVTAALCIWSAINNKTGKIIQ